MTAKIKVLAVDDLTTSTGVADVRRQIKKGAPHGWHTIKYGTSDNPDNHVDDLIAKLANLHAQHIEELEIVAEGAPSALDSVDLQMAGNAAALFGAKLKTNVPGITAATTVYLSGCNTGCAFLKTATSRDHDVAQLVANAAQTIVMGARGYINGSHAYGDDACSMFYLTHGPYFGSVDANGSDCWRECVAEPVATQMTPAMSPTPFATAPLSSIQPAPPLYPMLPLTPVQIEVILRDIGTHSAAPTPAFRVSPDRVVTIPIQGGGTRTLQIIANGSFLRDPESYEIWFSTQGSGLLTTTAPSMRK